MKYETADVNDLLKSMLATIMELKTTIKQLDCVIHNHEETINRLEDELDKYKMKLQQQYHEDEYIAK